jgi:parvulin-like peptidyl-prolyl isomerase
MPPEMRFKNYIDEKYGAFDNADAEFYRRMTISDKEVRDNQTRYGLLVKERKRLVDEAVAKQIQSGQVLNKEAKI